MTEDEFRDSVSSSLSKLAAEPTPKDTSLDDAIARIEKVSSAARANWFWFFGILGYAAITMMGVEDADFFSSQKALQLPVLNFSVDLKSFMFFAPILVTLVYAYLHGVIELLWQDLSEVPPEVPDGDRTKPIVARLPVWLLIEAALVIRHWIRPMETKATNTSPLGWIGIIAVFFLIWIGAPAIVFWFWWRSAVLQDAALTFVQGGCLWVCGMVVWLSLTSLIATMKSERKY